MEEYIKKEDILNEMGDINMDIQTDEVKDIVNGLPAYSMPDIEKISAELEDIKTEIGYAFDDVEGVERVAVVIDNVLSIIDKHIGGEAT